MKHLKIFFVGLFLVNTLMFYAQENDCSQFLPLFEAGEYDKVAALLNECKQGENLSQETINEFDFYLQMSYAVMEDYDNFDAELLEELTHNDVFWKDENIVSACFLLSSYYANSSNHDKATEQIDRTLFFAKHFVSIESDVYARVLLNSAGTYCDMGNFQKAIELGHQALSIQEKTLGVMHPDYLTSLNNLAVFYSFSGNFQAAIELGEQELFITHQLFGENHPDYALSLSHLGSYHSSLGNYSKAAELEQQALFIRKELYGTIHNDYTRSLNNLANYYSLLGNYQAALDFGEQVLEIDKQLFGENHSEYAISLNNLGNYHSYLGSYSKAIDLVYKALLIDKQLFGEHHPEYASTLSNLADLYSSLGNYSKAIELGQQALLIRKSLFGEVHLDYALSLNNLAGYYSYLGNYSKAIDLNQQALLIRNTLFGSLHPDYTTSLNNLAGNFSLLGDYQTAILLGEKALGIEKQILGETHPLYATSLGNLANYYSMLGDYQKAIMLEKQVLDIRKQIFGEKHAHYAASLNNLSNYYFSSGDYEAAIQLGEQALIIQKNMLGEHHPNCVLTLSNLASYYFSSNDFVKSSKYENEVFNKKRAHIQTQFNWLTENERQLYWNSQSSLFLFIPYFAYQSNNSSFIDLSYDGALLSKALMLNSSIELNNLLMESGDEEVIEKAEGLRTIQYTLNRLYEKPIYERFLDSDSLETVAQNLERDLLKLSKEYGDYTQFMSIAWQDVQKGLSENDVAIEFVEFPVLKSDSTMYAALVLRKGWDGPKMIPLFEKREIEQYMTQTPDKQYSGFVGKELYKLMWKPLEEVVQKGDAVHFSAAGVYHQLALEYLSSQDGTPLCDIYNFHRLSSTRQLALDERGRSFENATLYGGISYDVNPTEMLAESSKYRAEETLYAYRGMSADNLRGGSWVPLDNTVKEVEFITSELTNNKIETALFTGINANEESIKALSGKKTNLLHLATHGFFLPIEETRKVDYFQLIGRDDNPTPDMSMRRSGLIMAGGNRAWIGDSIPEGVDDGILTAQEISVLDFREMDLVVLSACETGLGDINTSEGVFGLQRAFKKAGAKTLIMSLWKVNDEVTKSLMNKFYQSLLTGKAKHDAFLEAQQYVRERHPEPQNWAAFIMLD